MDIKGMVEALVMAETKEERLAIAEENATLLEPETAGDTGEWEAKYNALLDKYTRAFFHGPEDEPKENTEPEPELEETPLSLDEMFPQ